MRTVWNRLAGGLIGVSVAMAVQTVPARVLAQGCAMCATAVDGANDPLARGLNVSIMFLLAMPFALVGSVALWFTYMYWRSRLRRPSLRVLRSEREGVL